MSPTFRAADPSSGLASARVLIIRLSALVDTEFALKTMLDPVSDGLEPGNRFEMRRFGSSSISRRPPRMGRDPQRAERVPTPRKLETDPKPGKAQRPGANAQATRSAAATGSNDPSA
jgi:integration host factor subunit beta